MSASSSHPANSPAPQLPVTAPNFLLYLATARTPVHVGSGEGMGEIDLPLMRGAVSQWPIWPGSGLKGVLRAGAKQAWSLTDAQIKALFGPSTDEASEHQGVLSIQDATLLALPVAALCGGWAWVSSLAVLQRLQRLCETSGINHGLPALPSAFDLKQNGLVLRPQVHLPADSPLVVPVPGDERLAVLGELALTVKGGAGNGPSVADGEVTQAWGQWLARHAFAQPDQTASALQAQWQQQVAKRFAIVDDESFAHLALFATEVRARVKLGEGRVAQDTALWREECLPPDTVMWGLIGNSSVPQAQALLGEGSAALSLVKPCTLQLGGKASVGYGLVDFLPLQAQAASQSKPGAA